MPSVEQRIWFGPCEDTASGTYDPSVNCHTSDPAGATGVAPPVSTGVTCDVPSAPG